MNGGIDANAILPGHLAGHVRLEMLVHIHGNNLAVRLDFPPVEEVRFQEVFKNDVRVGAVPKTRNDGGDSHKRLRLVMHDADLYAFRFRSSR